MKRGEEGCNFSDSLSASGGLPMYVNLRVVSICPAKRARSVSQLHPRLHGAVADRAKHKVHADADRWRLELPLLSLHLVTYTRLQTKCRIN